jgi:hypothetical protein
MPRSRPGKKERASKCENDQQALNRLNERLHTDRAENAAPYKSDNRISKQTASADERKFSASEVQAIVQAAVTAAVTTTTALLTGAKPKQDSSIDGQKDGVEKPKPLAERIKLPTRSLTERITFPKHT